MAATKKAKATRATAKPRQTWVAIGQLALKAEALATAHSAALGTRLTPAFLAAFAADQVSLNAVVPGAQASKQDAVQLTAAQNAALVVGRNLVLGVRTAVRGQSSDREVLLAYGVGTAVPLLVKDVKVALQKIVARAASNPTEAASFGVVGDDVTAINAALAAIEAADTAQEAARAGSPTTTAARNATAQRLLAGVSLIAGAGMRVFANDPTTRAAFAALK